MTIAMVIKLYLIAPIISWAFQHSCDIVDIISFADIRKTISFQLVWCDTVLFLQNWIIRSPSLTF